MKVTEQYFPFVLFIMLCKVVLTFESVDEIFKAAAIRAVFLLAVVVTLGDKFLTKSVILSQKIQLTEFLAISFCDFFSCRIICARVATYAIFPALATRQFFKKSHHRGKQKIARAAAA